MAGGDIAQSTVVAPWQILLPSVMPEKPCRTMQTTGAVCMKSTISFKNVGSGRMREQCGRRTYFALEGCDATADKPTLDAASQARIDYNGSILLIVAAQNNKPEGAEAAAAARGEPGRGTRRAILAYRFDALAERFRLLVWSLGWPPGLL